MATEQKYVRVIDDVHKIIHHAKLDENTLLPVTQAIYFADVTKEYKLLELNKELISKLNGGVELSFRGNKDEKAVLCSDDTTYEVKEAETSNSLLIIPNLKFPGEIQSVGASEMMIDHRNVLGVFHEYLEVKPCKPKMKKLRLLLEESSYRGSELESELMESGANMYSISELLVNVQASEAEVKETLKQIFAFELNGKWRVLELDYHFRILGLFLSLIDEQSWKIDEIPVAEVLELLNDLIPLEILSHLISIHTEDVPPRNGQKFVKLNENIVNRILGHWIAKTFLQLELGEFLKAWKQGNPLDLNVDIKQLDGLVYVVNNGSQKVIHYCPENELSEDVSERIQHLFKLKEKWTFEEIKPFIETFTTEKMDANAILTKYVRASKSSNGVRLYSSRHGK